MSDATTQETRQGTIGKYAIIRTLGKGGFGKVKLAKDMTTGQYVAIKIMTTDITPEDM